MWGRTAAVKLVEVMDAAMVAQMVAWLVVYWDADNKKVDYLN